MNAKEMGEFIAKTRKENQITQVELAKKLNVTDKAVSRWERGLGFPDINTLEPLADALGVSLTELMKCRKGIEENTDAGIIASIEIANYQRKKALRRIIIGGAAFLIGICTIVYAIKLYITQTWSLMIGGNDGSTSVFVAGKIGSFPIVIIFIIGMLVLICGIITMLRSKNNDK